MYQYIQKFAYVQKVQRKTICVRSRVRIGLGLGIGLGDILLKAIYITIVRHARIAGICYIYFVAGSTDSTTIYTLIVTHSWNS